ncbi:Fatty acyl-CoA elongase/Polyunsaturated fatty acid specific elongation enzyme [Tilletia horrida]|uniref:Elongation of fatty acids protein n=1 Tax=Tilletia horrida TaxID=155126 RepID=A0AAN6GV27_9BASI|nr:Fatty acyl-CoA elongase/Polyunsaturated fatty acid specific elongation enzyme [Tilletia horrida]KAK0568621.1 Fatty acyl-CoA elongase/Polyunsaturated fatty acid specific elongation enzyme [Tilletia horrida]
MTEAGFIYTSLAFVFRAAWPGSDASFDYFFTWDPPHSPWSSFPSIAFTLVGYLATIFGLRAAFNKGILTRPNPNSRQLKTIFLLHNIALSLGSALLLAAIMEEILPIWLGKGFFTAICAKESYTGTARQLYLINYFFKFWELLDTVFLVVKNKPLTGLHVFHHSATAFLCFTQLHGHTSVQWVVICLNLAVHTAMYSYYALMSLKVPCPWKRMVTTSQIVQFILDIGIIYFATYNYFVSTYAPAIPHFGKCAGEESAAVFGCIIISSYLWLFVDFYQRTYSKKAPAKIQRAAIVAAEKAYQTDGLATPADQEADYTAAADRKIKS